MKILTNISALMLLAILMVSCGDDDENNNPQPTPSGEGKITVHFDNQYDPMNSQDLELAKTYVTSLGDSIKIDQLRYWVSNIRLYNNDELVHEVENGYFLIENTATNTREMIELSGVPAGEINRIEFAIGVDAGNNDTLGVGKGELNINDGMFWTWNTGYKFLRMDGMYFEPDSSNYQTMRIHTGLNAYYIEKEMDLPITINVTENGDHLIHFMVSVNRIFNGDPNQIDVKEKNGIWMFFTEEDAWDRMNENIANMFMIHHAE